MFPPALPLTQVRVERAERANGYYFSGTNVNDKTFSFGLCLDIEQQLTHISKLTSEVSSHSRPYCRDKKVNIP